MRDACADAACRVTCRDVSCRIVLCRVMSCRIMSCHGVYVVSWFVMLHNMNACVYVFSPHADGPLLPSRSIGMLHVSCTNCMSKMRKVSGMHVA